MVLSTKFHFMIGAMCVVHLPTTGASFCEGSCADERGAAMMQRGRRLKLHVASLAQSGVRLSARLGLRQGSAVGNLLDSTVDMLKSIAQRSFIDAQILAKMKKEVNQDLLASLIQATKEQQSQIDKAKADAEAVVLPTVAINASAVAVEAKGEAVKTCLEELDEANRNATNASAKVEEIKQYYTFPEACDIATLIKYGNSSETFATPNATYLVSVEEDKVARYYDKFSIELDKCAEIIGAAHTELVDAEKLRDETNATAEAQSRTCISRQSVFTSGLCSALDKASTECDNYEAKYNELYSSWKKLKTKIENEQQNRYSEHEGVQYIMCFLTTLENLGADQVAEFPNEMAKCDDVEVDNTPVTVNIIEPQASKPCDSSTLVEQVFNAYSNYTDLEGLDACESQAAAEDDATG